MTTAWSPWCRTWRGSSPKLRQRDGTNKSGAWTRSDSPSVSKTTAHKGEEWTCMTSVSAATESTSGPRSGGGHASAGPWAVPLVNSWCYYRYTRLFAMFDSRSLLVLFSREEQQWWYPDQHHKLKCDIAFTEHSTYAVWCCRKEDINDSSIASYANKVMHLSCLFCQSFRSWKSGEKDLLSFQRLLAQTLLLHYGTKPSRQGRRSLMAVAITDATRFNKLNHCPCNTGSRYKRCKKCDRRTSFACEKCDVPLHVECFKKCRTA